MKRLTATTVLCLLLFSAAFVTGKGPSAAPEYPDSLRSESVSAWRNAPL